MIPNRFSGAELLLAEVGAGAGIAHVLHQLPPGLVGAVGALVTGIVLRLLDPWLKDRGERLKRRLTPPPSSPPPPAA